MTFQPVVPLSGYAGWSFLQRTYEAQHEAFKESVSVTRLTDYFRENISAIRTAEELVNDRRLLEVALGAFGLDEDINAKAFIREILEEGTFDEDALANRLADKRYRQLSEAFGFGDFGGLTILPSLADDIVSRYESRQFEIAVGQQDEDMRIALSLETGLADLFDQAEGDDAQWFAMMGNPPLRRTFEVALGFPPAFGQVDIDDQLIAFRDRAEAVFGVEEFAEFADPERQEELIRLFLVRAQVEAGASLSAGNVALTLLQSVAPLNPV